MKMLIAMTMCAVACAAFAVDLSADYVEGERSTDLIPSNAVQAVGMMVGEVEARALLHALRLQMSKYDADMRTAAGRRAWHGNPLYEIVDTNSLQKVEVYSNAVNGAIWRYRSPFKMRSPVNRASQLERLRGLPTNGVPEMILAARRRRIEQLEQGGVATTNIVINVGGVSP